MLLSVIVANEAQANPRSLIGVRGQFPSKQESLFPLNPKPVSEPHATNQPKVHPSSFYLFSLIIRQGNCLSVVFDSKYIIGLNPGGYRPLHLTRQRVSFFGRFSRDFQNKAGSQNKGTGISYVFHKNRRRVAIFRSPRCLDMPSANRSKANLRNNNFSSLQKNSSISLPVCSRSSLTCGFSGPLCMNGCLARVMYRDAQQNESRDTYSNLPPSNFDKAERRFRHTLLGGEIAAGNLIRLALGFIIGIGGGSGLMVLGVERLTRPILGLQRRSLGLLSGGAGFAALYCGLGFAFSSNLDGWSAFYRGLSLGVQ